MANRLANATSPYLLQHAHNPVDWYEWGAEALERARSEDKPLLLSIGYAACHWCHVMERESFENPATAALMNQHYICIKVDREERPDLDAVYMDAVQAMTGRGGWPMTMFCSPDGVPLYGGTYFPPEDRHGMPAFRRVLLAVADAWDTKRGAILEQGTKLLEMIGSSGKLPAGPADSGQPSPQTLRLAFDALARGFDAEWGGFGRAPKFPQPMNLEFLLRCVRLGFPSADSMLATTLLRMARGGIFDQAGGGFHRYSTDATWLVPHFEKMLYDNAQLLRLYARAAAAAQTPAAGALREHEALWRRTAIATGEYLLREMRHSGGGFFSSQDADTDGVEGKFYIWSLAELRDAAGDDAPAVIALFGASQEGNWEGANVLWVPNDPTGVAAALGITPSELQTTAERAADHLRTTREARTRPGTDDKILASWNGLAISALCEAGRTLDRPDFVDAARRAGDFVLEHLRDGDGRLLRSWRDGRTSGRSYLDDYAFMAAACLDLYETTFEERFFTDARVLADQMIDLFADPAGGFFDTGSDAEALVIRPKDFFDNAVPSGNAAAASMLLRLSALTGDARYEESALGVLRMLERAMAQAPQGFGVSLCALDDLTTGIREVAIAGDPAGATEREMARVVWSRVLLPRVLAVGDASSNVPLLAGRQDPSGRATAYVCEHFACKLPVHDPAALAAQLDDSPDVIAGALPGGSSAPS